MTMYHSPPLHLWVASLNEEKQASRAVFRPAHHGSVAVGKPRRTQIDTAAMEVPNDDKA